MSELEKKRFKALRKYVGVETMMSNFKATYTMIKGILL